MHCGNAQYIWKGHHLHGELITVDSGSLAL